jgi:hypothetical protein
VKELTCRRQDESTRWEAGCKKILLPRRIATPEPQVGTPGLRAWPLEIAEADVI